MSVLDTSENLPKAEETRTGGLLWRQKSPLEKTISVVAILMCSYHILFIAGVFTRLGVNLMAQPHKAFSLAFFLTLVFLIWPAKGGRKEKGSLPWYDVLLILAGLDPNLYYGFFFDLVDEHVVMGVTTKLEMVLALLLVITILEAGRRVLGWAMDIICLVFIAHPLLAEYAPGILFGKAFSLERLVTLFYLRNGGIYGIPLGVASTIVVAFVIFAQFLAYSGGAKFFLNLALSLFGSVRGGPAKVGIVASALFGTISGSPSANIAACGSVTIPLMKSVGYRSHFAGGVEAVASTGGMMTPPVMGTVAFIAAEMIGVSYWAICIAAILPAFLYYLAIFWQVDLEARKFSLKGLPREQLPSFWETLKGGWQNIITLVALVVFIGVLMYSPDMSAVYSIVVLWLSSAFHKKTRLGPSQIAAAFADTGRLVVNAVIPCALAGIIVGSLFATGFGISFASGLVSLAGGNLLSLLVLTYLACFILGMGMSSIAIYVTLAVLVAPALVSVGVPPIAAHLFIIYGGATSFITPPVAIAAFVAAAIAKCDSKKIGWTACRLGIVTFIVPFMFVYNQNLIMIGSAPQIILAAITAMIGTVLLAYGVEGYTTKLTNWLERVLLLASGVLMIMPGWQSDIIGIVIGALVLRTYLISAFRMLRIAGQKIIARI